MPAIRTSFASAALLVCALPARADLINVNFVGIVTKDSDKGDLDIGESQFFMDIIEELPGEVLFTIRNIGPQASAIANVYWDGDIVDDIKNIIDDPNDVAFGEGGNPSDLPGGNKVGFEADLRVSADPPPSMRGINPGESLSVRLNYTGTFADLTGAVLSGDLRIGLHAIAFASEGSESFINKPVPEPASLMLLGVAALAANWRRRRGLSVAPSLFQA